MKTTRSFASITVVELAAGALTLMLCAATLSAGAQAPSTAAPPATTTPAVPPSSAPPTAVGASGKPIVAADQSKVLADPETRVYSRCRTADEQKAPGENDPGYTPNPKAQVMSEEAAKAKGFKAGAHKVTCK
jgi:hypothetical protein